MDTCSQFDLRAAFGRHYFLMPADEDGSADNAGGEDDGQEGDNDNGSDNPRIKQLSDEAAKYRRERNEARQQLNELKSGKGGNQEDTVRTLRLELSFERLATRAKITDIETARRLVEDDLKGVKVEDGKVDGDRMQQIVDHVVERYPYLRDDYSPQKDTGEADPPSLPSDQSTSGRPVNGRRRSDAGIDARAIAKKYPALSRR